ncbi:uncharacterized protein BDR25DRAFT_351047 [Lindgomyces ingoldianus]|uniref:Uncharacterized protein n=1 Tax=Lindgomyces ingoldianus TaxID=673940 RepID=A0ACB6R5H3_9PLEO|nr:uncharacterized protein BDR25DRAFT_351047 [Lindgomyces ingoldianus]KAF2474528.1 hypothetical protein BDR25DRAFT_351047 [Lindgomyces ingoldianus]
MQENALDYLPFHQEICTNLGILYYSVFFRSLIAPFLLTTVQWTPGCDIPASTSQLKQSRIYLESSFSLLESSSPLKYYLPFHKKQVQATLILKMIQNYVHHILSNIKPRPLLSYLSLLLPILAKILVFGFPGQAAAAAHAEVWHVVFAFGLESGNAGTMFSAGREMAEDEESIAVGAEHLRTMGADEQVEVVSTRLVAYVRLVVTTVEHMPLTLYAFSGSKIRGKGSVMTWFERSQVQLNGSVSCGDNIGEFTSTPRILKELEYPPTSTKKDSRDMICSSRQKFASSMSRIILFVSGPWTALDTLDKTKTMSEIPRLLELSGSDHFCYISQSTIKTSICDYITPDYRDNDSLSIVLHYARKLTAQKARNHQLRNLDYPYGSNHFAKTHSRTCEESTLASANWNVRPQVGYKVRYKKLADSSVGWLQGLPIARRKHLTDRRLSGLAHSKLDEVIVNENIELLPTRRNPTKDPCESAIVNGYAQDTRLNAHAQNENERVRILEHLKEIMYRVSAQEKICLIEGWSRTITNIKLERCGGIEVTADTILREYNSQSFRGKSKEKNGEQHDCSIQK